MTASRGGIAPLTSAWVDVQYDVSFKPGMGGTAALAPVAIRQRSKETSDSPPALDLTTSVRASLKRASPRSSWMLGLVSRMPSYLA